VLRQRSILYILLHQEDQEEQEAHLLIEVSILKLYMLTVKYTGDKRMKNEIAAQ
jgi:hypothetical protein